MILYHRTYHAEQILTDGFKDGTSDYLTDLTFTGVWLSDIPLDNSEGAKGDTLLQLEIPEETMITYEWIEDDKPYREFLIPADVLNGYGKPTIVDEDND